MVTTTDFYAGLSEVKNFAELTDPSVYTRAPSDWFVIITDVQDSTKAIRSGHYKAVNCVGAATIIATLNLTKDNPIPYAFGGDGATLLIPPQLKARALAVLGGTREMAKSSFDLVLRIGCVPVSMIEESGRQIAVAKFKTSETVNQAAFFGSGLAYAEALVKDPRPDNPFRVEVSAHDDSALEGLECRWQPLANKNGEIVSLVVKAISEDALKDSAIYEEVLEQIKTIYGSIDHLNPVQSQALKLSLGAASLTYEARLRRAGRSFVQRLQYLFRIWIFNVLWQRIFSRRKVLFGIDWGKYRDDVILNSDYRKFDGVLRMVIDGNKEQRARLDHYLAARSEVGELVYGIHVSKTALITCLILNRDGNHIHLIDGNDGGYALAATQLKDQLKKRQVTLSA
jgi:hypothetical protein